LHQLYLVVQKLLRQQSEAGDNMAWKYPSVKATGWIPRGGGWQEFGRAIGGGLESFATQWMAIKQFEAEKEEKRRQRELEQLKFQATQDWRDWQKQKFGEQQALSEARLDLDRTWREKQMAEIDARIAKLQSQLEEGQMPKNLGKIFKAGLPVKSSYANSLYNYITQAATYGFSSKDWSWFDEIEDKLRDPQMLTYKESRVDMLGFPVETTRAATDMAQLSNMYFQIAAESNKFRETPRKFVKPEFEPAQQAYPKDSIQYRAERAKAIQYIKTNQDEKAQKLMAKYKLTTEEVKQLYREAGVKLKQ